MLQSVCLKLLILSIFKAFFFLFCLDALDISYQADGTSLNLERIRRVSSSTSISSMSSGIHNPYSLTSSLGYASVFGNIWKTLVALSNDPYPEIAKLAEHLVNYIKRKVILQTKILNLNF